MMRRNRHRNYEILIALALLLSFTSTALAQQPFPPSAKHPVTNDYHGVTVVDDYQWLEDVNDPAVKQWVATQNQFSRPWLEKLPARAELAKQIKTIFSNEPVRYYRFRQSKMFFAMKFAPPKNQPLLVMMKSADDLASEKTILDLNMLNPRGTTAIDFYVPSIDGRFVAVSLSEGGSEDGSVHIYETATGKELGDVIPRVNFATAGGSVAWNKDGTGFYYTRYPQGSERPKEDINFYQQVYFHKLRTSPSADTYVIGKEFPRIAEIELSTTTDASYIVAGVKNGDGGEVAHYLLSPDGKWTQVTTFADQVTTTEFGVDGKLYLLSLKGAPRGKLLAVPLSNPKLALARTIIPEGSVTINGVLPTQTRLYVTEMIGGPSEVRVFDLNGKPQMAIPTPPVSSVFAYLRLSGDEILFGSESYIEPFSWNRFDPITKKITRTRLAAASSISLSDAEVRREFATSRDGTKVPLNIIMRKGTKLDGQNPTLMYGYGGYSINETPFFSPVNRVWLDAGGIYVDTNIRGGGEFGDEWHRAGNLTRKQNVFDDFAACAQYLIEKKYTSPAKLAIEGGSNGGLLMGAALTQHPELFRAVVSFVGIYDMLRVELSPNGTFNITEFGTVKDLDQFKALYAYSPYHHVIDNTKYPAVLFITGDNDGRVDPMQSRKMTARLQAATRSGLPVLLRTNADTGHGIGTGLDERIAQEADVFAFLFAELGINGTTSRMAR